MRTRSIVITGACVAALMGAGAGTALAGEVTGNGEPTPAPERANSICAFSGQNDTPDDPVEGGRVQSYGQLVKLGLKGAFPGPGVACHGGSNVPE